MKDEIKEILEETRRLIDNSEYKIHYHYCIHYEVEHLDKLLDYITNLQEENDRLNNIISEVNRVLESILFELDQTGEAEQVIEKIEYCVKELKEKE